MLDNACHTTLTSPSFHFSFSLWKNKLVSIHYQIYAKMPVLFHQGWLIFLDSSNKCTLKALISIPDKLY